MKTLHFVNANDTTFSVTEEEISNEAGGIINYIQYCLDRGCKLVSIVEEPEPLKLYMMYTPVENKLYTYGIKGNDYAESAVTRAAKQSPDYIFFEAEITT